MCKKIFVSIINSCIEFVKYFLKNWFPYLAIVIGTFAYFWSVIFATEAVYLKNIKLERLEQIGTAWLLFGALWTALGAHLSKEDKYSLDKMAENNSLDPKEIVRIFKAASNFSTSGAVMILLGTIALFYKMYIQ